jgi:undecaprenyl-diphosphatase
MHLLAGGNLRRGALLSMLAWPVANAITDLLKGLFEAARPCIELGSVELISDYEGKLVFLDSSGTASGHAANMAAVATVMCLETKWWGMPWVVIALLTGLSRVYTGMHFPSQVILGWGVGIVCGWVASRTWRAYKERSVERPFAVANQPPIQSRID